MSFIDSIFGSKDETKTTGLEQVRGSQAIVSQERQSAVELGSETFNVGTSSTGSTVNSGTASTVNTGAENRSVGSKNDTTSANQATTAIDSSRTNVSSTDQLSKILESILGNTSSTVRKGDNITTQLAHDVFQALDRNFGGSQREAGREAARQASDSAIKRVLSLGLGDIRTASTMSGGYDSTTRQIMTDNLAAQAAREGSQVELDAMTAFSDQQLNAVMQTMEVLKTLQDSNISTLVEERQTKEGDEQTIVKEDSTGREVGTEVSGSTGTVSTVGQETTQAETSNTAVENSLSQAITNALENTSGSSQKQSVLEQLAVLDQLTSTEMDTAQSGTITERGRDSLFDNAMKAVSVLDPRKPR